MPANELPIQEAADLFGRSRQFLQKQIKKGNVIARKKKNRVYVDVKSLENYFKTKPTGLEKTRTGETFLDQLKKQATEQSEKEIKAAVGGDIKGMAKVEMALKMAKYEAQKLLNEQKKGELIKRTEIGESVFEFFRSIRDDLQTEPDRLALKLFEAKTIHEVTNILREANHKILHNAIKDYSGDEETVKKKLVTELVSTLSPQ
jgi:hypothetical protein